MRIMHAVRAVIKDSEGRTLLMQRSDFLPGYWEIPGGEVDPGETHEQALLREINEESGLTITLGEFLGQDKRQTRNGTELITHIYSANLCSGVLKCDPAEHWDANWFDTYPAKLTEITALALTGKVVVLMSTSDI